jgi:2-dehydropantoate 2-reductase
VYAVVLEPGLIRHTANDRLTFGELDGSRSARLVQLHEACLTAGFKATLSEHIEIDIWIKFVWLSVFSGVTTVTRLPIGRLRDDPDLLALCQAAGMETMAVAHAKAISLPAKILDEMIAGFQALPPQAKSSMLDDLERGRRLELPWLSGSVVRIGEEAGVLTPTHRFITTVLMPYAAGKPSA